MTVRAFGHELVPVLLKGQVVVKLLVTLLALEPMPPAIIPQAVIGRRVALTALHGSQGYRIDRVQLGELRNCPCRGRSGPLFGYLGEDYSRVH